MGTLLPTGSNDNDDSLSLSEYTDNEKSAPTELLAEFLTSIMKKDYANALKYCKLSKKISSLSSCNRHLSQFYRLNVFFHTVLDFEPNNKTAKDFFPQLQAKVNELNVSSNSDGSDENCNYTSSLDYVDNEILDNDLDAHQNSYVSSESSSESSDDEDFIAESVENSSCDEVDPNERDDLLISLSHSSSQCSNSSKSDQLPESMSSTTTSSDSRRNTSHSLSFTSLLLDDSNEFAQPPAEPATNFSRSSSPQDQPASSPFTKKLIQLFK